MNYDNGIKKISFQGEFLTKTPVTIFPARREFMKWVDEQPYLTLLPQVSLKNIEGEPISTNIHARYYPPDNIFAAQLKNVSLVDYGLTINELGKYRGRSGYIVGLMNRLESAFCDPKAPFCNSIHKNDVAESLALLKIRSTDDLALRAKTLCEADGLGSFPDFSADMTTSAGPRFYKKNRDSEAFASITRSKDEIMQSEYGVRVFEDASELMKICSEKGMPRINDFRAKNPSMFAVALRGKEEVVNVCDPAKCRPYYCMDIVFTILASEIFEIISDAIVPFWEDPTSISALGFNWYYDKDDRKNGVTKIFEFLASIPKGQTRSMGYGDDMYAGHKNEDGSIDIIGPDVAHLDMSVTHVHFQLMQKFLDNTFQKLYPEYNSTWVYGFLRLYLKLLEDKLLYVFPHNLTMQYSAGLPSGVPGTTVLDIIAMLPFHNLIRKADWSKLDITKLGASVGFHVKEETCVIERITQLPGEIKTTFLGCSIFKYTYSPKEQFYVPGGEFLTYAKTALFPKYSNPKTTGETAAWHMLRLYGIAMSGGMFYKEFTACGFAAFQGHKKALISSGEGENKVSSEVLENFTVSRKENSYIRNLVGKEYKDIEFPTVAVLLTHYYPEMVARVVTSATPIFGSEISITMEKDEDDDIFNLRLNLTDEEEEVPPPFTKKKIEKALISFVQPDVEPQEKINPMVGLVRSQSKVANSLDKPVLMFLQNNHKRQYDNYMRLLAVRTQINELFVEDGDQDLVKPVQAAFDSIFNTFLQTIEKKYIEEVVEKSHKKKVVDTMLATLQEIAKNLSTSWGSSPPVVFPLMKGPVVDSIKLSDPPNNKKPPRKGIGTEVSGYLDSLKPHEYKQFSKLVLDDKPFTPSEKIQLDKQINFIGKEKLIRLFVINRITNKFEKDGVKEIEQYYKWSGSNSTSLTSTSKTRG